MAGSMRTTLAGAAGASMMLLSLAAAADTPVTASLWVGPKHPVSTDGYDPFVEKLEKNPDFSIRYFQGGALLGAKPTLSGVSDGIADVGMMAMTYFPAEFPNAQLVADMGLATPSNLAATMAATEYNLLHCEACLQEYLDQNIVYTGTYSTSPYSIISNEPIRTVEDLAGKKMRVPGSLWSRWARSVDGIEVNVPSSEMYEGLDKGALDIAIQAPGALRSYSLWDTAKYVTLLNLGTYHSLSLMSWNRDTWRALTDDERRMMLDEAARAGLDTTLQYTRADEEVLALAGEHGVELIEPSDELVARKDAFVAGDVDTIIANARDNYGIADAAEKVAKLQELIAKWQGIVEEVGAGNRDALLERFRAEVYDKLDDTYGT